MNHSNSTRRYRWLSGAFEFALGCALAALVLAFAALITWLAQLTVLAGN